MLGLKHLMVITKREYAEQYLDFFHRHGVNGVVGTLCNGTANDAILSTLSLEDTEKVMFKTMITEDKVGGIAKGLLNEMNIGAAGNGIALFVPIDAIGGNSSLRFFVGDNKVERKEKTEMAESKSVLIISVVDKGYTDVVMEAARGAGAGGGTVVRAKGTGSEIAKFFGVSISEEKEMVYIVASRKGRDNIMRAIMEKAGGKTDAHGIIFSLPVDGVIGIRQLESI
ncbi:MAG: P-II family nitrogen regulator [Clostridia bacterium]|nr:P-II family nitrogen regulator [Clostridia bacterium]